MLKKELVYEFGKYINNVSVAEFYQLNDIDIETFDCVLTDIPAIKYDIAIPVKQINCFIHNQNYYDLNDLNAFFSQRQYLIQRFKDCFRKELFLQNVSASTKEEIIHIMAENFRQYYKTSSNIEAEILKREKMSSTELGNCVAIPTSLYLSTEETLNSATGRQYKRNKWHHGTYFQSSFFPNGHCRYC